MLRCLILLICSCAGPAVALDVQVLGADGQPLPGTIVTYVGENFSPPPLPRETVVDQRSRRFEPYVSLVAPGAAVSFPNSDDTRHHVYSFSEGNAFELKLYRSNDAPPVILENPGVVTLGCNIHDNMKAYIVVSDNAARVLADARGVARLPWLPAGVPVTLRLWHPELQAPVSHELDVQATASGQALVTLPVTWEDPQAVRSVSELESLLKRYSRDAH